MEHTSKVDNVMHVDMNVNVNVNKILMSILTQYTVCKKER
jgi:hypothetical protein